MLNIFPEEIVFDFFDKSKNFKIENELLESVIFKVEKILSLDKNYKSSFHFSDSQYRIY
jgi:hypothetical protein